MACLGVMRIDVQSKRAHLLILLCNVTMERGYQKGIKLRI